MKIVRIFSSVVIPAQAVNGENKPQHSSIGRNRSTRLKAACGFPAHGFHLPDTDGSRLWEGLHGEYRLRHP